MIDPILNIVTPIEKQDVDCEAIMAFEESGLPLTEFTKFIEPYNDWLVEGVMAWMCANRN